MHVMGGLVLEATATFPFGYASDDHGVAGLGRMVTLAELDGQPTWRHLHPEFRRRVAALMVAAAGDQVPLGIGTGWRSYATQLAGYRRDPRGHARPGNSNHEGFPGGGNGDRDAVAADMVPAGSWAWMDANCARFGLRTFRHVGDEPWHVQPVEIPAGRNRRVLRWELASWPIPGAGGPPSVPVVERHLDTLPERPAGPTSPIIERTEIAMQKTVLDPDKRSDLTGNGDIRLFQVLALGLYAASGNPTFDVGVVDADYGPRTQAAASLMQQLNGLAVDGIVGPVSWAAFLNADGT